jgi:Mrp family chromosome partitioning ATPase
MSLNLLVDDETKPVVWRGPVIAGTVKQFWSEVVWNEVDFMFVDMPPGTGDVPLTVFQSLPLDGIVIVTSPQELVGMIVEKAVNMASLMDVRVLGLVENYGYIVCPDCGKVIRPYGESKIHALAEKYNTKVLAELPIDPNLASVCDKGLVELFEGDYLERCCDELEKMN